MTAFKDALPAALRNVETADADGDAFTNLEEIQAGNFPGNPESHPPLTVGCPPRVRNPYYDVCFYDPRVVFRKVGLDFCGKSPSFEDLELFASFDETQKSAALEAKLDECLDSDHWIGQDGALWKLAHRKIRPLEAIKLGAVRNSSSFRIPLADYDDDYALFVYTQTDDRDARDVLTGNYFVRRSGTNYTKAASLLTQSVPTARRAGMLTTKWNLVYHIMFTPLPRTAAAQAYRAYLGLDIAKQDGLDPVDGEPVDYDAKGVTNPTCAVCHSTLDPLSYPFSRYQGLTDFPFGTYDGGRMGRFTSEDTPRIGETPEQGVIFGQAVADLVGWARVAADSDAFAKATVADYWSLLVGDPPGVDDAEFIQLWRDFATTHQYRVESMLRDLIRTEAYGEP
ncbi:MAG: hypothetical protein HY791_19055 [Deltaproteobacteria bacterium]|nr:hypothetical protein [Deltaproteobacteria bacterium]